ncbi:unnamed protein product [marine sediment metagenome]|uniref:Uncharacterized protein n=1 Tax=marine sediment metagenome TaxID=412755 RepID=X1HPA8_9ZZZZ
MRNGDWLVTLIEDWFDSDLEIQFALRRDPDEDMIADAIHGVKDKRILLCTLVHQYNGGGRWFIVIVGDNYLYEEVKEYCRVLYDKERTIDLIEALDEEYTIFDGETFDDIWYADVIPEIDLAHLLEDHGREYS